MADLTTPEVAEIKTSTAGNQEISQAATRAAISQQSEVHQQAVQLGGEMAIEAHQEEVRSEAQESFNDMANQYSVLRDASNQGKLSKAEVAMRGEAITKEAIRRSPADEAAIRALARDNIGFDPTGAENQVKLGTFKFSAEELADQEMQQTVDRAQAMGINVTMNDMRNMYAEVVVGDLKLKQENNAAQLGQRSAIQYSDQFLQATLPTWSTEVLGKTVLREDLSTEEKKVVMQGEVLALRQKYINNYMSNMNSGGQTITSVPQEALERFDESVKGHTLYLNSYLEAKDPTKLYLSAKAETDAHTAWLVSLDPGARKVSAAMEYGGPDMAAAVSAAMKFAKTPDEANAALRREGFGWLVNMDSNLRNGKLAELNLGLIPETDGTTKQNIPKTQQDRELEQHILNNSLKQAGESDWSLANVQSGTLLDQSRPMTLLGTYAAPGSGMRLKQAMAYSGNARQVVENVQAAYNQALPQTMLQATQFFTQNPEMGIVVNPNSGMLEVQAQRSVRERPGRPGIPTAAYSEAKSLVNKFNTFGALIDKGGMGAVIDLSPEHMGGNFANAISSGLTAMADEANAQSAQQPAQQPASNSLQGVVDRSQAIQSATQPAIQPADIGAGLANIEMPVMQEPQPVVDGVQQGIPLTEIGGIETGIAPTEIRGDETGIPLTEMSDQVVSQEEGEEEERFDVWNADPVKQHQINLRQTEELKRQLAQEGIEATPKQVDEIQAARVKQNELMAKLRQATTMLASEEQSQVGGDIERTGSTAQRGEVQARRPGVDRPTNTQRASRSIEENISALAPARVFDQPVTRASGYLLQDEGYTPSKTANVPALTTGNSGLTIAGYDLKEDGANKLATLQRVGVDPQYLAQAKAAIGLKGKAAEAVLKNIGTPVMSAEMIAEAQDIFAAEVVRPWYEKRIGKDNYAKLDPEVKAAYEALGFLNRGPKTAKAIKKGLETDDWKDAVKELNNYWPKGSAADSKHNRRRAKRVAELIKEKYNV